MNDFFTTLLAMIIGMIVGFGMMATFHTDKMQEFEEQAVEAGCGTYKASEFVFAWKEIEEE